MAQHRPGSPPGNPMGDLQTGSFSADDEFGMPTTLVNEKDPLDTPAEQIPPGVQASLEGIKGSLTDQSLALRQPVTTLGRTESNQLVIPGAAVSSQHCVLYFTRRLTWRLEDCHSTNGTFINGSRIEDALLRSGDEVQIGDHTFLFVGA
ncbi:MAG: FHA domain-containing protein [Pseudomonadota bacterium]